MKRAPENEFALTDMLGGVVTVGAAWYFLPTFAYWMWIVCGPLFLAISGVEWWLRRHPEYRPKRRAS